MILPAPIWGGRKMRDSPAMVARSVIRPSDHKRGKQSREVAVRPDSSYRVGISSMSRCVALISFARPVTKS
ncbi:unnamed protein product [Gemmata massiliana]|uniref:Uncharacterized protein n=1 Tax=Gemmata massiliana TaxID=1210884 RepID=A0A6P2D702_9BACT|nr:unnamed protein product [Gemmata massiliana]